MMKHEFKLQWGLPLTGGVAHEMALRPLTIGGELAANLDALYDYMGRMLLQANLHNDEAKLDEVAELLVGLRESWVQIDPAGAAVPEPSAPPSRAVPSSYGRA